MGSIQDWFGISLGSLWDQFGIDLGSFGDQSGMGLLTQVQQTSSKKIITTLKLNKHSTNHNTRIEELAWEISRADLLSFLAACFAEVLRRFAEIRTNA